MAFLSVFWYQFKTYILKKYSKYSGFVKLGVWRTVQDNLLEHQQMTLDESYFPSISNKKNLTIFGQHFEIPIIVEAMRACFRGRKKGSCFLFGATMFVFVTRNYYQSYCYTLFQTFVLQVDIFQKVSFNFIIFYRRIWTWNSKWQ